MIATLGGVLAGLVLGLVLRNSSHEPWSMREAMYVKFIGELFLRMLKAIIIPLIVPALIASIGSLSIKVAGKVVLFKTSAISTNPSCTSAQMSSFRPVASNGGTNTDPGSFKQRVGPETCYPLII